MILSVRDHTRALNTAKEIVWLLGLVSGRHGPPLGGGLELLGRGEAGHLTHPAAAAAAATRQQAEQAETVREQEEALLHVVRLQQMQQPSSKQGVVLSLPRRALQGWLLREGRAWREEEEGRGGDGGVGGGGDGRGRWTPSWVEDGIDVVPPTLPGFGVAEGKAVDSGSVSGGGSRGSKDEDAPVEMPTVLWPPAREVL